MPVEVEKIRKKNRRNKSKVKFEEESIDKQMAVEVLSHMNENKSEENKVDKESLKNHEVNMDIVEEANNVKSQKISMKQEPAEVNTDSNERKEATEENGNEGVTNKNKIKRTSISDNSSEITETKNNAMKKKKRKSTNNISTETTENETEGNETKKKRKSLSDENQSTNDGEPKDDNPEKPGQTKESIRAQRRKKHLELQEQKKQKAQMITQSNVLNYLSKWKHARSEWKFEKLKQIWLAQNLYESSKVPNDFWETALEYFEASKGFIRNLVLRESIKIIEAEDQAEDANPDEEHQNKVKRARDIVQTLQ